MRRIRSSEPGARILFDAGTQRHGNGVTVTVAEQIAVDGDVRKLLDAIRQGLARALIARAKPNLAAKWSIGPTAGGPNAAATEITVRSSDGDEYLAEVFDRREAEVVPPIIEEWISRAIPESGDGVGTESGVNTSGVMLL